MSCTKFYFNNLALDAVLTPETENAQFPVENIQDARRTKVFRSTSNSDFIYFDFGSAEPIDSIFLVGHTLDGLGFTTASLELNSVATWVGSPGATIAITVDSANNIAFGELGSPVTFRYAKLILTSTLGYCEVSKIFIGVGENLGTENDFSYPLNVTFANNSTIQKNRYGQRFVDEINEQKKFSGDLKTMTNAEVEVIHDLARQNSNTKPFFLRISNVNVFTDNDRVNGYYYLTSEPQFSYESGGFWSVSLAMEEGT
jgi:hypothetical protein